MCLDELCIIVFTRAISKIVQVNFSLDMVGGLIDDMKIGSSSFSCWIDGGVL